MPSHQMGSTWLLAIHIEKLFCTKCLNSKWVSIIILCQCSKLLSALTYWNYVYFNAPTGRGKITSINCNKLVTCFFNMMNLFNSQLAHKKEWGFHNARVNCIAWSPNSLQVASGSLDTAIIIWSVTEPAKHTIIKSNLP